MGEDTAAAWSCFSEPLFICSLDAFSIFELFGLQQGVNASVTVAHVQTIMFTIYTRILSYFSVCRHFDADAVLWAMGATALVSLSLTLFALQSKVRRVTRRAQFAARSRVKCHERRRLGSAAGDKCPRAAACSQRECVESQAAPLGVYLFCCTVCSHRLKP